MFDWKTYHMCSVSRNLFYAAVFDNGSGNRNAFEEFAAAAMVKWYFCK